MSIRRSYPESWQAIHHRAPRVASCRLSNGRLAVLSEPCFLASDQVLMHLCEPTATWT